MKMSFLRTLICIGLVAACRPHTTEPSLSGTESLSSSLQLQSDFSSLPNDSCVIELTKNFNAGGIQSVGDSNSPQCLPASQVSFRGRMDVESSSTKLKSISVALLVDNSVSLKDTDPSGERFGAIDNFLDQLDKVFSGNIKLLRVQVLFFSYCGTKRFRLSDYGSITALKSAISKQVSREPDGATNYLDALEQTKSWIALAPDSEAHVVLFSDGMPFSLSPTIPASCSLKVSDVPTLTLDSQNLARCANSSAPSSCREPSENDVGFAVKNRPAWDDPTNYAIGMRSHYDAFAAFSKTSSIKRIDSVYLNGGCYEERAARTQGDSARENAFHYLCTQLAPNFFRAISTGQSYEIKNASGLKDALQSVSENIVKQVGFQKVTASVDSQSAGARAFRQGGETEAYNFEINPVAIKGGAGTATITAYASSTDGNPSQFSIHYAFNKATDPSTCSNMKNIGTNGNQLLLSTTTANYRMTCKAIQPPQDCTTQSGVKVSNGDKETAPGFSAYHVAYGHNCSEVNSPRSRVCTDGKWGPWTGGPYTSCSQDGPASCGEHTNGSSWDGDTVYYEKTQVAANETCRGERDKFRCDNGTITTTFKTSYTNSTCQVESHQNCGAVPHGGYENSACYYTSTMPAGSNCIPFYRKCNDGLFDPTTCPYTSCQTLAVTCQDSRGAPINVGASNTRIRYRYGQVAYGATCESELQSQNCGSNGIWSAWSGSFLYETCFVSPAPTPVQTTSPTSTPVPVPTAATPQSDVSGQILSTSN